MDSVPPEAGKPAKPTPLDQAKLRTDQAESRAEQAISRAEAAETRTEQAEQRIESAKTRTEQAETRTEQAETRTEWAETRAEHAETRAEHAETTLAREILMDPDLPKEVPTPWYPAVHSDGTVDLSHPINLLTARQREILQLIAQGQNTKQIAALLHLSPKTVEYHRLKLMNVLNVHDVVSLVRLALRLGVIRPDS